MRGRLAALAGALLMVVTPALPAAAATGHAGIQRLKIRTLNIFYGGDDLDLASTRRAPTAGTSSSKPSRAG